MRVLLGLLGGIIAVVLFYVAFFSHVIHLAPKVGSVGVTLDSLIKPSFVLGELLSFAIGFTLAWMVSRPRH